MNPNQIAIVKSTWSDVISEGNAVGELFYKILFELDPSLKPLFGDDVKEQARKFTAMITFCAYKLNDLDSITAEAKELGRRHKYYKTTEGAYRTVEKALIAALAQSLGAGWTEEAESAWGQLYITLENAMLEGATV